MLQCARWIEHVGYNLEAVQESVLEFAVVCFVLRACHLGQRFVKNRRVHQAATWCLGCVHAVLCVRSIHVCASHKNNRRLLSVFALIAAHACMLLVTAYNLHSGLELYLFEVTTQQFVVSLMWLDVDWVCYSGSNCTSLNVGVGDSKIPPLTGCTK